jgi:hypothetical protein
VGRVNANREHFELAVADLAKAKLEDPGGLGRPLTHRLHGLEVDRDRFAHLSNIKAFCEVAAL